MTDADPLTCAALVELEHLYLTAPLGLGVVEAVGRLAGGVAHDFNNLLTVILGHATLLLKTPDPENRWHRSTNLIKLSAERAARLASQLLTISRKQTAKIGLLNLNDVIRDTSEKVTRLLGDNIRVSLDLSPDLGMVLANHGEIAQVLLNLLGNAQDAMPTGGQITITTHASPSSVIPAPTPR